MLTRKKPALCLGALYMLYYYRFLRHSLRNMHYLCETVDCGNRCPACPEIVHTETSSPKKLVFAMDALFGLPRKKSVGTSIRSPLHGELFFVNQHAVDEFVSDNSCEKSAPEINECNDFVAGNILRSARRYAALDETGVFGYCCRHEFPGKFMNLKHGERLAYPVWMLDQIVTCHGESGKLFVMYDIACSLHKHLQVLYGPRRCEGIGLSDGETMERLWSYLRRFHRMTKEMRPSHRIDILSSALAYYGIKTKDKLASLLLLRWDRALKCKTLAEETLRELVPRFFQDDKVRSQVAKWLADEEISCKDSFTPGVRLPKWKSEYVQTLQVFYTLRDQLVSGSTGSLSFSGEQFSLLISRLEEIERKHCIQQRWAASNLEYRECLHTLALDRREHLLVAMWKSGQRRAFLLTLKKKYADGQKIAKRLSQQISKETAVLKSLLKEYNAVCSTSLKSDVPLSLPSALDPKLVEEHLSSLGMKYTSIATGERRHILDAFSLLSRSEEELLMLKQESQMLTQYYEHRKQCVVERISEIADESTPFSHGAVSMLKGFLRKTEPYLNQGSKIIILMDNNTVSSYETDSDSSSFSEDSDDDD